MTTVHHVPVLLQEVLAFLDPRPGQIFVDATVGLGGHSRAILEKISSRGKLIGFEHDTRNADIAMENLLQYKEQIILFRKNFSHFSECLKECGISSVDGILFDLGISSLHLDIPERGFSFRSDGPLDMRMNISLPQTAADILAEADARELTRIFREYGQEPRAFQIAEGIVRRRTTSPFTTTKDLANFIHEMTPKWKQVGGGHPATLVFQALRIAVNDELSLLESVLPQTIPFLKPGGRLAVISFHSLEDRIVKNFFRRYSTREKNQKYPHRTDFPENASPFRILTKKPISPCAQEIEENPRARSARMRVVEKIPHPCP